MANLYQKLLAITEEIGKIEKTGRNDFHKYNFIEAAEVTAHVKAQCVKHGVLIIPSASNHVIAEKEKGVKATIDLNFIIINAENPEETITATWLGEGDDTSDKATQKAGTSGVKYFYMKLFNISDKDDPDAESPETGKVVTEPKLTAEQVKELIEIVKGKGIDDKNEAINLINTALGATNFAMLPTANYAIYKKQVENIEVTLNEPFK